MRSRSSRLFIVLLHLVGVRTNLPLNSSFWKVGIVGVHPISIVLDNLKLDPIDGLDGLMTKMPKDVAESVLSDPYWLQADIDGRCFGPTGFSECGDATLWILRRREPLPPTTEESIKAKIKAKSIPDEDLSAYAIQLLDIELMSSRSSSGEEQGKRAFMKRSGKGKDNQCLMLETKKKKGKRKKGDTNYINEQVEMMFKGKGFPLRLGPCSKQEAWNWKVDGNGTLKYNEPSSSQWGLSYIFGSSTGKAQSEICIWRADTKLAIAAPCDLKFENESNNQAVQFSLIRYQMNADARKDTSTTLLLDAISNELYEEIDEPTIEKYPEESSNLPHSKRSSDFNSKYAPMHPELKPVSKLLFPLSKEDNKETLVQKVNSGHIGYGLSHNTLRKKEMHKPPLSPTNQKLVHISSTSMQQSRISVATPRKIPVHPYIKESKNGVWKDPQTDLEFLTDLSGYLGDDRKTKGRHTLMGVGQYTRTVFNIKVYGVALYVSKRDLLADPNFIKYSTMSVEDIHNDMSVFDYLQEHIKVDRTLVVKLNMQLGVDTIRSSLEADWKQLTSEHKKLLIDSSMNPRPAHEPMLKKIKSPENSSRCSCSQSAPPEFQADMTCCSRGTEMAFTWRKNGNLEVRVDGRLMDSFSIPGIAEGIFFEYLRTDDPISMDALLNFANGFPFLLAPLAQVKGASVGQKEPSPQTFQPGNHFRFRFFGVLGMINDHANGVSSWVQENIDGTISNFARTAKSVREAAQTVGGAIDRNREETLNNVRVASSNTLRFAVNKAPFPEEWKYKVLKRFPTINELVVVDEDKSKSRSGQQEQFCHRNLLGGHYSCGSSPPREKSSQVFGSPFGSEGLSDEIGVIIHPNTNFSHKIFTYSVHLYLLLLLIVSLPESTNTRTRIGSKRESRASSECSSDDEYKKEFEQEEEKIIKPPELVEEKEKETDNEAIEQISKKRRKKRYPLKKSLSYFL